MPGTSASVRSVLPLVRSVTRVCLLATCALLPCLSAAAQEPLPFNYTVETFRDDESDVVVFALRLEQPFLAEEFEKSNFLRLEPLDEKAYLIYPKETRFRQKHAEFYGRLRGDGTTKLKLAYEIVSENLDGSRKVDVRSAEVEVPVPVDPTGIDAIYKEWARQQNNHFADLLRYYPETSFFEYVLLQSKDRYGVKPPELPDVQQRTRQIAETGLYHTFSGGLALQQALQWRTLSSGPVVGDLNTHVSTLEPPVVRSPDYDELLQAQADKGAAPQTHDLAKLIPRDQYFLHFNSMEAANELMDVSTQWGSNLLRMLTVRARDQQLREKYEDQMCIRRDPLSRLFADEVIAEFAVTGSDFFVAEGTDLTLVFRLKQPELFDRSAAGWLAEVRAKYPSLVEQDFNYRGHRVSARYTNDRMVSSFVIRKGEYAVYSNSHVAIKKVVDTMIGNTPSLHDAPDYQYVSTLLPPSADDDSAYLYGSEDFLKHLISPEFKIAEKRRLQSFNNLVMLNNASMFYRLEYGRSPDSLTNLVEGQFFNPRKIVDPTGGAYAYDAQHDTATSTIYNRIKYLTPILELDVLNVSRNEQQEYDRYKKRYESFWGGMFDPVAVRMTLGQTVKLETCVLPLANSSLYSDLRRLVDAKPQAVSTAQIARSAVMSVALVPGRKRIGGVMRAIPGVPEVLEADPTLTDLSWLGDRMSIHFLDDDTILEIDPTRLQPLQIFGEIPVAWQAAVSALVAATNLPVYFTIDVEDEEKAVRLLDHLTSRIFLKGGTFSGLETSLDAYQLPAYKEHKVYVLSTQLYAVKFRLHIAMVGGRLVAATKQQALREVIDASLDPQEAPATEAHALVRFNFAAMDKIKNDLQLYWGEKLRRASHRNIMPIYNLVKLYDVPIGDVNRLADAKYGVTYFCPGGGEYEYDADRDQVYSTVYGNRQEARQTLAIDDRSSFAEFINGLQEVTASLRFDDEALIATVEIIRKDE